MSAQPVSLRGLRPAGRRRSPRWGQAWPGLAGAGPPGGPEAARRRGAHSAPLESERKLGASMRSPQSAAPRSPAKPQKRGGPSGSAGCALRDARN